MSEPLSVEYAKSGKSGCKRCKNNITKGELRLGFVGKANFGATAWYHYDCLWSDYENLKSIDVTKSAKSLIKGYSDVGQEDQDKIERDLPKFCKIAVEKASEKASMPTEAKPPMAAEYAKSAKSSCKGCEKTIDKGVLRVGFTGKANFGTTAWYHYNCVWEGFENLKSIDCTKPAESLVEGFDELKEDDQKKLERDLPKSCKSAAEKNAMSAAEKTTKSAVKTPFTTDYAKSDKSTCKGCSENITKGSLRVGCTGKAHFGAPAWYHFDCLLAQPKETFKGINVSDSIQVIVDGFDGLKKDDQENVEKKIKERCGDGTTETDKRKGGVVKDAAPPAKKAK